jgi:hypothetical protein
MEDSGNSLYVYIYKFNPMKKESKEMLRTILSNQELIMKALKIEVPASKPEKPVSSKPAPKKAPVKKNSQPAVSKKTVKKK